MSRKFKESNFYDLSGSDKYHLLPFNFHRINNKTELLVNLVGDYLYVPKGTYEKVVLNQIDKNKHTKLYQDLLASFFISEDKMSPMLEVISTRYRTRKSFLEDFTSLHIFVITLRCEHTCHYCQVSRVTPDKVKYDMKKEDIDTGIEYMMQSPNKNISMEFQGGEPLLAFDSIKYAVKKASLKAVEFDKNLQFVICTNLSTINEEILSFCNDNDILISTSLDGPEDVHNFNRKLGKGESFKKTIEGIKLTREVLGHDKVSALMTTSVNSLKYPIEIIDIYHQMNFQGIFLRPISPYGFAVKSRKKNDYETKQFLDFYKKGLEHIIDINLKGDFFMEDYTGILLRKILTPFSTNYVDLTSPAGCINSAIVFNYNGKVYASDEARMLSEMEHEEYCLGELSQNSYQEIFYGDKTLKIAKSWSNESIPGCSDCAFQGYCGADPIHNYATQGDSVGFRPTNSFCQRNMEIIRYLFELMENPEVMEVFHSWIAKKSFT